MKPTDQKVDTEAPKREIDWLTMFDRSLYLTQKDDIDLEALERFVIAANSAAYTGDPNDLFDPSNITVSTDEEAALNAAGLITVVLGGIEKGCDMNTLLHDILGARKTRDRSFNPHTIKTGSPAWKLVEKLVHKEISYKATTEQLMEHCHLSKTSAERAIRVIRSRIEHPIDNLNSLGKITFRLQGKKLAVTR